MPELDIESIFMQIVRMAGAILFIFFMMLIFFSFRVEIKDDSMSRFTAELADSFSNSPLTIHRSVYDTQKLDEAEAQKNSELYAWNCEFGYDVEIESLTDGKSWKFGYMPSSSIKNARSEFPVGISTDVVLPAKLTITAHDTALTRLSCVTQKAYELKEIHAVNIPMVYIKGNIFRRTDQDGTHVCMYSGGNPIECRYLPDVKFEPFNYFDIIIDSALKKGVNTLKVTASPLRVSATCGAIKSNPDLVVGTGDRVATVVLCGEVV